MFKTNVIFLLILALAAISCEPMIGGADDKGKYHQFTTEDLSFLYYNADTLVFNGDFTYCDTVVFLVNNSDTLNVAVNTKFYSFIETFSFSSKRNLSGLSAMEFDESLGFRCAQILIHRSSDTGEPDRRMEVWVSGGKDYLAYFKPTYDTAFVLGKIYQEVYKIYPPANDPTLIKSLFFAKKYGFIKIERTDGRKLELIKIQSKDNSSTNRLPKKRRNI